MVLILHTHCQTLRETIIKNTDPLIMSYKLPTIEISQPERLWLEQAYAKFKEGKRANVGKLKRTLYSAGRWPQGFHPYAVDRRLLDPDQLWQRITLLGLWHVDPDTDYVRKCDQIIWHIKNLTTRDPDTNVIKVDDISQAIGISPYEVSMVIHLISLMGRFWASASGEGGKVDEYILYHTVKVGDPEVLDEYSRYEGIERLIEEVYGTGGLVEAEALWDLIHPEIVRVSRSRFESGHFADSVEAALKEVNSIIKAKVKSLTGEEIDGAGLMNRAFSPGRPLITLGDLSTESGRNMQQGYMQIFAGAMIGIRNPKAHENISIDENRAIHLLILASLLMHKLDESI